MKYWSILFLVGVVVLMFNGCHKEANSQAQLGPRLRQLLETVDASGTTSQWIPILGATRVPITDALRAEIEKTGAKIGTAKGTFFTADVPVAGILKLAHMREIKYLQLSEKAKPAK